MVIEAHFGGPAAARTPGHNLGPIHALPSAPAGGRTPAPYHAARKHSRVSAYGPVGSQCPPTTAGLPHLADTWVGGSQQERPDKLPRRASHKVVGTLAGRAQEGAVYDSTMTWQPYTGCHARPQSRPCRQPFRRAHITPLLLFTKTQPSIKPCPACAPGPAPFEPAAKRPGPAREAATRTAVGPEPAGWAAAPRLLPHQDMSPLQGICCHSL